MKKIKIKIDGRVISCLPEETIMTVAQANGIKIPGLCGHPDFPPKGNCRVCVVEIKGDNKLRTSCSTKVVAGMEIITDSPKVKKTRNLNLELIFSEHIEKCPTCPWRYNCKLLNFAEKYKIEITRFRDRKKGRKIYKFANAVEIDGSQCIDCRNCLDACSLLQNIHYLELKGKGANQEIVPVKNYKPSLPPLFPHGNKDGLKKKNKVDCIYCGQCAVHCPVSAAQEQSHWQVVDKALNDKSKVVVAQFAPSIRVSIGEEFGLAHGRVVTGQVVTALRQLGFSHVFDVSFGADITTMVEAEELLERVKKNKILPMFTSCCPAWVKYVEFFHPELIPNLTSSRSPHIHNGGVIKNYWAAKMKIKPKDIVVVSVMPCTAKKFEAARREMKIKGLWPVDYVITTREMGLMLKNREVDFAGLKKGKADSFLGEYSGAGVIYGGSGGVMESALRTAQYLACKKEQGKNSLCRSRLEFMAVRGLSNLKEATVKVEEKKLRVAVVNGIGQIEPVLNNLSKYDYIEVMACPGGCIGGGGQPVPTTPAIRQKRIAALYKIDKDRQIRRAHENKEVSAVLKWLKQTKQERSILHTKYIKRS